MTTIPVVTITRWQTRPSYPIHALEGKRTSRLEVYLVNPDTFRILPIVNQSIDRREMSLSISVSRVYVYVAVDVDGDVDVDVDVDGDVGDTIC
jgi:hypothetical protein